MKRTEGGEIVQVEGGHIIRAIGKKDRHSKVITAKGPRDRRVRLSAHTAIQFYDVQDRLGYDRPSKAVDWLIKKAQNAIDKLAELPPWNPNENSVPELGSTSMAGIEQNQAETHEPEPSSGYTFNETSNSSFMADSMRSFFPTSSGTSLMNFQNYSNDVMRRNSTQNEDLGLSLHTLQVDANYANNRNMGLIFSSQSISPYPIFGQNLAIPQRETLQSNYTNLIHAWNNHNTQAINQNPMSSSQFGASEYSVPARIQGDEEETGVLPVRSSLSPPLSRY